MSAAAYREATSWEPGTCTWCREPLSGLQRTFCSDNCVESFKLANDPIYVRKAVSKRDRGICAHCGVDTLKLVDQICQAKELVFKNQIRPGSETWLEIEVEILEVCATLGLGDRIQSLSRLMYETFHVWEADHVVPVIEGGENGMGNIQTLCIPCHKRKTAAWHRYGKKTS